MVVFQVHAMSKQCEPIGDGILESMFNPNCGLDIYETCDENTWVKCKLASHRLQVRIFSIIVVIVLIIVFFAVGPLGKVVTVLVGVGIVLLGLFGSAFIESRARVEYQRLGKELEGMEKRGISKSEALLLARDERLRRETNDAVSSRSNSQPLQAGVAAGITSGLIAGLFNRK